MKKIFSLLSLSLVSFSAVFLLASVLTPSNSHYFLPETSASHIFQDISSDAWFHGFVKSMFDEGIIGGYSDAEGNPTGFYGPSDPVTVGQVAKIVGGAAGFTSQDFPGEHWARGWIELFPELLARRPELIGQLDSPTGREVVAEFVAEAAELDPVEGRRFSDTTNPWINAIADAGIVSGYPDGTFLGDVNRAEMAKFGTNTLDFREGKLSKTTPTPEPPPPPPPPVTEPQTRTNNIIDFAFTQSNLTINVGDTVIWKHIGSAPHTVSGGSLSSGRLDSGGNYSFTFTQAGEFSYSCEFHPSMTGNISVK